MVDEGVSVEDYGVDVEDGELCDVEDEVGVGVLGRLGDVRDIWFIRSGKVDIYIVGL